MSRSSPSARPRRTLGPRPDARQASPQHVVVRNTGGGDVGGDRQRKVDDPAPLGPIPVVVDVPLRIEGAADAYGGAGLAVIGEMDPRGQRPGIRSDFVRPPNGANLHLCAGGAVCRGSASCRAACGGSPRGSVMLKSGLSNSLRILLSPDCSSSSSSSSASGRSMGSNCRRRSLSVACAPGPAEGASSREGLMTPNHSGGSATFARPLGHLE